MPQSPFVEKKRLAVAPVALTSNGTAGGIVTIADTSPFFVKQIVALNATGLTSLTLQVKRILSPTQMLVGPTPQDTIAGPNRNSMKVYSDISAYTTALSATIGADEQIRQPILEEEVIRATYMEEPAVALRNYLVDGFGRGYDQTNPFPITGSVGKLVPIAYDKVHVNYDGLGNPTSYEFFQGLTLVGTITLTYDINFNVTDYVRT